MTNAEYNTVIAKYVDELNTFFDVAKKSGIGVIGENLLAVDLCFCAMLDRSVKLTDGFISMLKTRNLTCAGALLRLQMDNCMRLFAIYTAKSEKEIVDCVMKGECIDKLYDKSDKRMTDKHLKEQLEQFDPKFADVYNQASGFIHFSEKSYFQSVSAEGNFRISCQISKETPEKANNALIECAQAYINFSLLFLRLMNSAVDSKKRFDANYKEED